MCARSYACAKVLYLGFVRTVGLTHVRAFKDKRMKITNSPGGSADAVGMSRASNFGSCVVECQKLARGLCDGVSVQYVDQIWDENCASPWLSS